MEKLRTKIMLFLAIVMAAALCAELAGIFSSTAYAEASSDEYYYSQLTSSEAKAVYAALADMKESDMLQTGTATIDLVEKGYLDNREYNQNTLTAAFGAGKDAFMLDNADMFYIDFDKISLRMLTDGTDYRITLGIGREDTYLADGFTPDTVEAAISAFNAQVNAIAAAAGEKSGTYNKILSVYEAVMDNAVYALEFDAGDDADYVRCPYGVLVKGKGVCQSFAQAVKVILDKLNITNVVVQGTYIDGDEEQPHMWNYVLMDDNRWYILDATMDNAWRDSSDSTSLRYFLMNGTDGARLYAPDGVISTSGFEFEYPSLCMVNYTQPSTKFTIEEATAESGTQYQKISYNGMGLRAAEEKGYYILFTFDVTAESSWMYVHNYINNFILTNFDIDIDNYDFDSYFDSRLIASSTSYIFAVTTDAPESSTVYYYTGGNVTDKSNAVVYDEAEAAPYAVTVTPDSLRFYIGSSYNVTIIFNDDLVKIDESADVTLEYSVAQGVTLSAPDKVITNVVFDESTPDRISFTFTPDKNYSADRCDYTFTIGNAAGSSSGKAPVDTILHARYKPSFSCPVNPLSYCTAVASVPTLISDSDLSVSGWTYTDEDGQTKTVGSSNLSSKISLVATTYSAEENSSYESAVNEYNEQNGSDVNILSSATYDLSLNLCDMQVSYLNGEKVMIMVPFPDGYSSASAGVSFKAYHFNSSGEAEEIDCYCTEYGIILFCSSFSAYTVAAVQGESTAKNVLVTTEGYGTVTGEKLVTIEEGGSLALTLTADNGYCIDSVTVNGKVYSFNGAAESEFTMDYEELDRNTTVIVKFASSAVVKSEIEQGFTVASAQVINTEGSGNTAAIIAVAVVIAVVVVVAAAAVCLIVLKLRKRK